MFHVSNLMLNYENENSKDNQLEDTESINYNYTQASTMI